MAWKIICELLLLTKFVSLSVIPDNRKITIERKQNSVLQTARDSEDSFSEQNLQRHKRNVVLIDDYEDDQDEVEWESVCPTFEYREELLIDHQGNRMLTLSSALSSSPSNISKNYKHFVKTVRCARREVMVGTSRVKCVQKHMEETLVVYDTRTEEVLLEKPIFIASGCEAKMMTPR